MQKSKETLTTLQKEIIQKNNAELTKVQNILNPAAVKGKKDKVTLKNIENCLTMMLAIKESIDSIVLDTSDKNSLQKDELRTFKSNYNKAMHDMVRRYKEIIEKIKEKKKKFDKDFEVNWINKYGSIMNMDLLGLTMSLNADHHNGQLSPKITLNDLNKISEKNSEFSSCLSIILPLFPQLLTAHLKDNNQQYGAVGDDLFNVCFGADELKDRQNIINIYKNHMTKKIMSTVKATGDKINEIDRKLFQIDGELAHNERYQELLKKQAQFLDVKEQLDKKIKILQKEVNVFTKTISDLNVGISYDISNNNDIKKMVLETVIEMAKETPEYYNMSAALIKKIEIQLQSYSIDDISFYQFEIPPRLIVDVLIKINQNANNLDVLKSLNQDKNFEKLYQAVEKINNLSKESAGRNSELKQEQKKYDENEKTLQDLKKEIEPFVSKREELQAEKDKLVKANKLIFEFIPEVEIVLKTPSPIPKTEIPLKSDRTAVHHEKDWVSVGGRVNKDAKDRSHRGAMVFTEPLNLTENSGADTEQITRAQKLGNARIRAAALIPKGTHSTSLPSKDESPTLLPNDESLHAKP